MFETIFRCLSGPETPRGAPPSKRSDRFANAAVVDQFGRERRFRDDFVDGRALIVNMMYTTCRGTCPTTSAVVGRLREALSPIFPGPKALSIVSITLEPAEDSPKALLRYAASQGADRPRPGLCDWHFLTGKPAEIETLRRSLGFYDLDPKVDRDPARHAALLLFGNTGADRWAALPADLPTPQLVEAIRRACGSTFFQKYGVEA